MNIIIGPPGTGKTTRLLNLVEQYMAAGVPPDRIGYFAYTRQASQEAVNRACLRFGLDRNDFPYFRTLHSLAHGLLGVSHNQMMKSADYYEIADWLKLPAHFHTKETVSGPYKDRGYGDKFLEIISYSRISQKPLREVYNASTVPLRVPWLTMDLVDKGLRTWKQEKHKYDFTDLLETFVERRLAPKLEVLFVDEAQDLSPIQWRMVEILAANSKETYIAGDDDQAIFRYAGADVSHFIHLPGKVEVLNQSYRIPRLHYQQAARIIQQIKERRPKSFRSRDEDGVIQWHRHHEQVDLSQGEWLLLARTKKLVNELEEDVRRRGYFYERANSENSERAALEAVRQWERLRSGEKLFAEEVRGVYEFLPQTSIIHGHKTMPKGEPGHRYGVDDLMRDHGLRHIQPWEDALTRISPKDRRYIQACLRKGETLKGKPRIRISTIHSSKGGQADNVLLMTDKTTRPSSLWRRDAHTEDDERRVFYVGLTRAKHSLHLIQPQKVGFRIPRI